MKRTPGIGFMPNMRSTVDVGVAGADQHDVLDDRVRHALHASFSCRQAASVPRSAPPTAASAWCRFAAAAAARAKGVDRHRQQRGRQDQHHGDVEPELGDGGIDVIAERRHPRMPKIALSRRMISQR